MKFSILIANYNNGKFFQDCYKSILQQTYQNWEVVILDDASTDNSVEVIKNIIQNDSRFRWYENEKNFMKTENPALSLKKFIELIS